MKNYVTYAYLPGLRALHSLSYEHQLAMRVIFKETGAYAEYDNFKVKGPHTQYTIQGIRNKSVSLVHYVLVLCYTFLE